MVSDGIQEIKYPDYGIIKAYFLLSPGTWIALGLAWLFVIICCLLSWEITASGSVLVGASVIAEVYLDGCRWRRMNAGPSGRFPLRPDSRTGLPLVWGDYVIGGVSRECSLIVIGKKLGHIFPDPDTGYPQWGYEATAEHAEKRIVPWIVVTIICGTVLWGYGHLVFN